jgi:hypothetical protein
MGAIKAYVVLAFMVVCGVFSLDGRCLVELAAVCYFSFSLRSLILHAGSPFPSPL